MSTLSNQFSEVLIVGYDDRQRQSLRQLLHDDGFHAVDCRTAVEASDQLRRRQIAVAILDSGLPDLADSQLLEQIGAQAAQLPVIFYDGAAAGDAVRQSMNGGNCIFVEKIADQRELLRHVHQAYRRRVAQRVAELEAAVQQRTEQLARVSREFESFASIVAHDLRTPLLTISGYSYLLQHEYCDALGPGACEYLDRLNQGVARMGSMIQDLLSYSRISRTNEPFEPVDLAEVLAKVVADYSAAIQQAGATIDIGPMPAVVASRNQMRLLFQNLLGNSLKFRREEVPRIEIRAVREAAGWQFTVRDNGMGIAPEEFERVFKVFHRVHGQDYPGTGIGLPLCRRIVERHGGRIWLTSELSQGTTVYFTITDVKPRSPLPNGDGEAGN